MAMDHKEMNVRTPVRCFVLTISDTRTEDTDESGNLIISLFEQNGHSVVGRTIVPDEPTQIRNAATAGLPPETQVLIITGGTGIAKRDTTIDTIMPLIETELPGFGELFRMLSYEQIGARAMLSRAAGGLTSERVLLFCLPGSIKAVQLAMEKLILPAIGHIFWEMNR